MYIQLYTINFLLHFINLLLIMQRHIYIMFLLQLSPLRSVLGFLQSLTKLSLLQIISSQNHNLSDQFYQLSDPFPYFFHGHSANAEHSPSLLSANPHHLFCTDNLSDDIHCHQQYICCRSLYQCCHLRNIICREFHKSQHLLY